MENNIALASASNIKYGTASFLCEPAQYEATIKKIKDQNPGMIIYKQVDTVQPVMVPGQGFDRLTGKVITQHEQKLMHAAIIYFTILNADEKTTL